MTSVAERPRGVVDIRRQLVFVLFLLSGACGLIYEVLWSRQLGLIFGNTVHSLSTVLTAFMAGLALGSYVAGRLAHRLKRPLFVYGVLEFMIGAYCALLPFLFSQNGPLVPLYRALYNENGGSTLTIARFLVTFFLLLIPTSFMGATLPVLSQFLVRSRASLGHTVGVLYGINSLGAVAGAACTGFFLLPEFGKLNTNWLAVACNVLLGIVAVTLGRNTEGGELAPVSEKLPSGSAMQTEVSAAVSPTALKAVVFTFGLTGFAAMATQIGWTRAMSLAMGSSTYAFSLILAVFILGLSAGGFWGARAASRSGNVVALLSRVLLGIGLACMLVATLLGIAPHVFFFVVAWGAQLSWPLFLSLEALGIGVLIFVPTFLMGATTPLTMQVASNSQSHSGRIVGSIYAVNTLGAILGSALGGLVLIPVLHIQSTLELSALMYAVPGLVLFALSGSHKRPGALAGLAAVLVPLLLLVAVAPRWNPLAMSSGAYLMRDPARVEAARRLRILDALPDFSNGVPLYYNEGTTATVGVTQRGKTITLTVGGKPDASNRNDMPMQVMSGLLPVFAYPGEPQDVLIIGLGSGVTAGAMLSLDTVKNLDVIEMSPEVVEASWYFSSINGLKYNEQPPHWIDTPRLNLKINDGRNHLLLTGKKYDVITCEPSNPWIAGIGNLFTKEAFELSRSHLKPRGVMCQWLQSYSLEQDDFNSIVRTFISVFPYHRICWISEGDFLLLGSESEFDIPASRLQAQMAAPAVKDFLVRCRHENAGEIYSSFLDTSIFQYVKDAPLHTDDNMRLEFSAPRALHHIRQSVRRSSFLPRPESVANLSDLPAAARSELLSDMDLAVCSRQHLMFSTDEIGPPKLHDEMSIRLRPLQYWGISLRALKAGIKARQLLAESPPEAASPDPLAAMELLEADPILTTSAYWPAELYHRALLQQAARLLDQNKPDDAAAVLLKCTEPAFQSEKLLLEARMFEQKKNFDGANAAVKKAVLEFGVSPLQGAGTKARLQISAGQSDQALDFLRQVLGNAEAGMNSEAAPLFSLQSGLLRDRKMFPEALAAIQHAVRLDSLKPAYWRSLGSLYAAQQQWEAAVNAYVACMSLSPGDKSILAELAETLLDAANARTRQDAPAAELLHSARRVSRELSVLFPAESKGSELLARSFLALEKTDSSSREFYHEESRKAYLHALELCKGDTSKLNAELIREFAK